MDVSSTPSAAKRHEAAGWHYKLASMLFVFFCFEVGAFLMLFPWLDNMWEYNYFATLVPAWEPFWSSAYVRGAVSGLGLVNIWISFAELSRLRRFSNEARAAKR